VGIAAGVLKKPLLLAGFRPGLGEGAPLDWDAGKIFSLFFDNELLNFMRILRNNEILPVEFSSR
jgi:hypothetical protein